VSAAIIERDGNDVLIRVKAVPGASRDEIVGAVGDRLKVRVCAAPEGGKANSAICRIIAAAAGIRPKQVMIEQGNTHAHKLVRLTQGAPQLGNVLKLLQ
jgi:hypothetical protein